MNHPSSAQHTKAQDTAACVKALEVPSALATLNHHVGVLQNLIDNLTTRLQPVMSADSPRNASDSDISHSAPIAECIRGESARVEDLCNKVSGLLQRIEI